MKDSSYIQGHSLLNAMCAQKRPLFIRSGIIHIYLDRFIKKE